MPPPNPSRREFIQRASSIVVGAFGVSACAPAAPSVPFTISLAQWSLNRAFRGGGRDAMDFARIARQEFEIEAIEYVNQFYFDTLTDALVNDLKSRADGEGVQSLLIMCDREGAIGAPDAETRAKTVANHHRWANAARALGCHALRVNAQSSGTPEEQMKLAADGLRQLADYCAPLGLHVLVENHGGISSNGAWLAGVMRLADHPRVGTLPDFGNFTINRQNREVYDRYLGVEELMPFARAVSAKSYDFDDTTGEETTIDFTRMLGLVTAAGYRGRVGIEYEGNRLSEPDGIRATKRLLEKIQQA